MEAFLIFLFFTLYLCVGGSLVRNSPSVLATCARFQTGLLSSFTMFIYLLSLLIRAPLLNATLQPNQDLLWESYKSVYGKNYLQFEEGVRRYIWEQNLAMIAKHNFEADLDEHGFKIGITNFTDRTLEELKILNGLKIGNLTKAGSTFISPSNMQLPNHVDWRKENFVTKVKDQGFCGSCWAFATTGVLEGQHKRKTGKLVSLSEQNLVDCSTQKGNLGCNGGLMNYAYEYIKENHGIDTETSYPYTGREDQCHFHSETIGATLTGWVSIDTGDEKSLKAAVATVGPVAAAINADGLGFKHYKSGIYDYDKCSPEELNHGILIVGYGTENGKDYWIVKNSWGTQWGENGYVRIARNKNLCGIAALASYPLV